MTQMTSAFLIIFVVTIESEKRLKRYTTMGWNPTWGAFTYDVRCFGGIFDLPTYPNQMLYYIPKPI